MNWDRGFRRVALILSITCAIISGLYTYKWSVSELETSKRNLYSEIHGFTTHIPGFVDRVRKLEKSVKSDELMLFISPPIGAIVGFCGMWVVYAVTRWGALPLYKWISVGFREDLQKGGQKGNGPDLTDGS